MERGLDLTICAYHAVTNQARPRCDRLGDPGALSTVGSKGISNKIAAAITHQRIYGDVTEPKIYLGNGLLSRFPLAKTLTLHHYKTPHWVPVCLSIWRFSDKPMTTI